MSERIATNPMFRPADQPPKLPRIIEYAETKDRKEDAVDRSWIWAQGALKTQGANRRARRLRPILRHTARHAAGFAALSDADLQAAARTIRPALRCQLDGHRLPLASAGRAFALVREAARRVLGLAPYDVQLLGAWAMMRGQIAEMRTGEGKTLCATLAVATTALTGRQVHVMTVNDYLARRDAEFTGPLYDFLGLTRAVVLQGQDEDTRRAAYRQDIVYGTSTEIAFDYLRDRAILRRAPGNLRRKLDRITGQTAATGALRMQGLPVAFIDEADSVLIDEARTPLIISGAGRIPGGLTQEQFAEALAIARKMDPKRHFRRIHDGKQIEITDPGFAFLDEMTRHSASRFTIDVIRDHTVVQALNALHLFHKNDAYIIRENKLVIVDENTGRVMPDRNWSEGLHQLVELKEGLPITEPRETLSRMTYQRFFRRYAHLGGMTGTARDAAWELWSVYRLAVARIPTHRPDQRRFARDRVFADQHSKWAAIIARVRELHQNGQPVLIGTRSIADSQSASRALTAAGLRHTTLSADQDANEALLIGQAGQKGAIMVATNMAGRGADIPLGPGVAELSGLAVLLSARHDSRRVDRQFEGRCARQGAPGRIEAWLALDDMLMSGPNAAKARALGRWLGRIFGSRAAAWCIRIQQRRIERAHAQARWDLMAQDREMGNYMAFSGELE